MKVRHETKYLFNLDGIPDDYKNLFESLNQTIKAAFDQPGKLKRNAPGIYYVVLDNELVQLDNQADESGEWIARECSPKAAWHTDGHSTLRELKKELGI